MTGTKRFVPTSPSDLRNEANPPELVGSPDDILRRLGAAAEGQSGNALRIAASNGGDVDGSFAQFARVVRQRGAAGAENVGSIAGERNGCAEARRRDLISNRLRAPG